MLSTTTTPEKPVYCQMRADSLAVVVSKERIFFFDFSVSTAYSEPLTIPGGADLGRPRIIEGTQKIVFLVKNPSSTYTSSFYLYDTSLSTLDSFNVLNDFISAAVNSQKNMGIVETKNKKEKYVMDLTVAGSSELAVYDCEKEPKAFDIEIDPEDGNFYISKGSKIYAYKFVDGTSVTNFSVADRPKNIIHIPGTLLILVTCEGDGASAFNYETNTVVFSYTFTAGNANNNMVSFEIGTRMALFARKETKNCGMY